MTMITAAQRALGIAALLGAAGAASACGPATTGPATTGTATTASPSVSSAPGGASASGGAGRACATSALKASVDTAKARGAAGSIYYPIDFTNISGATCTLEGYPGVSFVTSVSGSQIGAAAGRNMAVAPAMVSLAPGGVAHATLQVGEAGNYDPATCNPVAAHWLRVYPPDQTSALFARFTTQVCSATLPAGVGAQLSVYAIRAGAGGDGP